MGNTLSDVSAVYQLTEKHAVEHEDLSLPDPREADLLLPSHRQDIKLLLNACSNIYNEFAKTSVYNELKCHIMQRQSVGVTLIGNTGDGKTTAAKALAWELYCRQGFLPTEVRSIQEIKDLYQDDRKFLILVDDPFGAYHVYWDFVKDWAIRLSELDKYINEGNMKIIITTRTQIWEECKYDLKRSPPFDKVIDVSTYKLTIQDRQAILSAHLSLKDIDISGPEWKWKIDMISNAPTAFGFPLRCKLACQQDQLLHGIFPFFEQPLGFIREELRRVIENRPELYSALVLLMLNDGVCSFRELDPLQPLPADLSIKSRDVLKVCGFGSNHTAPSPSQVRRMLEKLKGTFLQKTADGYAFPNENLFFAVALEVGHISPEMLFKHAHPHVVIKTFQACRDMRTPKDNVVPIRYDLYPLFAAVLTKELIKGHLELAFSNQSWLEEEFYEIWESYVLSEADVDDALLSMGRRWQRKVLHCAARKGLLRLVKFLMSYLRVDATSLRTEEGVTVLHSAAMGGHANVVDFLLKQGFDPNAREDAGWTPLYVASVCGHTKVASLLLLAGADPNICTIYGSSPIFVAAFCEHWDLLSILSSWGARSIDEMSCPGRTEFDLLSLLVQQDDSPVAALLRAVRTGQMMKVVWLLDYGANVNDANACGWSSLYVSALCGRGDIASLLLNRGANPRQATIYGRTPSYVARLCGHTDIVKMIDSFERGPVSVS